MHRQKIGPSNASEAAVRLRRLALVVLLADRDDAQTEAATEKPQRRAQALNRIESRGYRREYQDENRARLDSAHEALSAR